MSIIDCLILGLVVYIIMSLIEKAIYTRKVKKASDDIKNLFRKENDEEC